MALGGIYPIGFDGRIHLDSRTIDRRHGPLSSRGSVRNLTPSNQNALPSTAADLPFFLSSGISLARLYVRSRRS
jgi:hypothetical protein